ncbi:PHP domain-containing protein [Fundicoccus culcitae]|uniref:Histidinol-phosphatase n=1 Tax=Fundicoccus culcitae TaxID=2969821 RepID=A0ABY5P664_9LACT|nr:PHP domain-containing protein [Fundicoccus culcitae]UUX34212.1 PHP domain-containing protein [Fundicoccus culcitae]
MEYYDQHMHTFFSPDSTEKFENYLKQTDNYVVTTEHLDYYTNYPQSSDVILYYASYSNHIDELNRSYNNRLLKGIEVGYTKTDRQAILDYLSDKSFDIILLSIHQNGNHGFMTLNHDTKPIAEHLEQYFSIMLEGVKFATFANVLAHFDFGLRGYDPVHVEDLIPFESVLKEIFTVMIENNQAFELNTRSMYRYHDVHLYDYAIEVYQSVGGKLFTVSSDAHVAADYRLEFDAAFELLRKHEVKQLVVYQKQQPIMVNLP